jgi:hypothetical protein
VRNVEGIPQATVPLAVTYQSFADREVALFSPSYAELCRGVAADPVVLRLIEALPEPKRQPNLLLAAVRWLGGPVSDYPAFRDFVVARWTDIAAVMRQRRTQTNEAGRCGTLLPALERVAVTTGRPLALIEVGASAGLCLYPDHYRYRYGDGSWLGPADSPVALSIATSGPDAPVPTTVPRVIWRAGIDINPLDVADDNDMRWLQCLVWPEQTERRERLRAAVATVRADPPMLVRGDLNETVADLVAKAPAEAAVVVFHTAVLAYLDEEGRARFADQMASLPVHWVSNETPQTFPSIAALAAPPTAPQALTLLALDGVPMAYATPHGQYLSGLGQ